MVLANLDKLFRWAATLVVVALIFFAGMTFKGRIQEPEVVTVTEVVYKDRQLAPKDTADATVANRIEVFQPPEEELTPIELDLPSEFLEVDEADTTVAFRGIHDNSVHVSTDRVEIVAWDFARQTHTKEIYEIPEPAWDYGLRLKGEYFGPGYLFATAETFVQYQGLEVNVGPTLNPINGQGAIKFGLTYEF